MRRYIFKVTACAGLLGLLASAGFAQNTSAQQKQGGEGPRAPDRTGRQHMRGGPRAGRLGLRRLNLSDAQREQLRAIESRYAAGFRTKREELRSIRRARRQGGTLTPEQDARARRLREQLRAEVEELRGEMRGVLNDEQRAQLQSLREEMKQRRELRRERREEFREWRRQRRQQQQPPAPPNAEGQL